MRVYLAIVDETEEAKLALRFAARSCSLCCWVGNGDSSLFKDIISRLPNFLTANPVEYKLLLSI